MTDKTEQDWESATWEGSRRAMIRRALKLTVRQRLQILEDMCITSRALARANKTTIVEPQKSDQGTAN